MEITAKMVNELRQRTNAPMMDAKKALVDANGDMEKAVELLRERGAASADKGMAALSRDGEVEFRARRLPGFRDRHFYVGLRLFLAVWPPRHVDRVLDAGRIAMHGGKIISHNIPQYQAFRFKSLH